MNGCDYKKYVPITDEEDIHVYVFINEDTYVYGNKVYADFLGISKESLYNLELYNLFDKETYLRCLQSNKKVIKTKKQVVNTLELLDYKGDKHRLMVVKTPIIEKNYVKYIVCIACEVYSYMERRKRNFIGEQQYRDIVENQKQLICRFLPNGTLTFVNKAYCNYFEKGFEELIGKNFLELVPEDNHEIIIDNLKKLNKDNPTNTVEHKVINGDGKISWQRWIDQAYFDTEGNIIEIQSVGTDITEIKEREEYFRDNYEKVNERIEKTKEDLYKEITERKVIQSKLKDNIELLKLSLNSSIDVILKMIEIRDPYTVNHQVRVANLAYELAKKLNLSNNRQKAVYISALLHDVGKIYIPSDFLSKPSKLTEMEFNIIKNHSEMGYNILKKINFPWDIGKVVYQHHERENGSGYPLGLKGKDILLEAKIIAISDVIEAMSSHRPYRPALGIDVALEEINKNKGKLYDPVVSDALIKLFNEDNYNFSNEKYNIGEFID